MKNRCLYCYKSLATENDFHEKCSLEFFGTKAPPKIEYTLEQMTELAKSIVEKSVSVPGVQAKLSMSLVKETTDENSARLTIVGALGGRYIFKPPTVQFPEMPENEHLTMSMAKGFGIQVAPSSLIRLTTGELAYITKRMDRTKDGQKIHMLDMFQITEAFDKYKSSIEKVGKALNSYSDNTMLDKIFFFELTLFSFLTGNNDMHLKNFSMIESASGWVLAPAYDLLNVSILIPEDKEELALTLVGKKRKFKRKDFEHLGAEVLRLSEKQISGAFKRMVKNKPVAIKLINLSFLSNKMKTNYKELLEERYAQIEMV